MPWRYQPVLFDDDDGLCVSLCEVYFDKNNRLTAWSQPGQPRQYPAGGDIRELQRDLVRMLMDSYKWVPIPYGELSVGMEFHRAIAQDQCDGIAQMVEAVGMASKPKIQ